MWSGHVWIACVYAEKTKPRAMLLSADITPLSLSNANFGLSEKTNNLISKING